jgi:formylglycine-generating enzyme required for sulfatase activity
MGTGGAGGSGGAPTVCPTVADTPTMVKVQAPAGGPFYCVDSTEVTNTQYLKWMASNPDVAVQIAECASWNTNLAPSVNPTPNALPVANVDWCDAYTFCETHGKRLCGRVGGGPVGWMESVADSTKSEWQNGCSAGNSVAYPYGGTYDGLKCNGKDQDAATDKVVAVGSSPGCVGGFPGIFDMSGNVWEWENTCDNKTGANDNCRRRGGGYTSQMVDMDCSSAVAQLRSSVSSTVGFRCCTDPQ